MIDRLNEKNTGIFDSNAIFLILIFFGISCAFQWVSYQFGYQRDFLSIEMFLAFTMLAFGIPVFGIAVFLASILLEIMLGIASVFYLFRQIQIWDMLEFLAEARRENIFQLLLALLLLTGMVWVTIKIQKKGSRRQGVVFLAVGVLLLAAQWQLSSEKQTFFYPTLADRQHLLFGSTAYHTNEVLKANVWQMIDGEPEKVTGYSKIQHPSAANMVWPDPSQSKRILFVVDEAWGLPKDKKMLQLQIDSLKKNKNVVNFSLKTIYAKGATATGELRELCGVVPSRMNFRKITESDIGECIPKKLSEKGYRTIAIHGASGNMYNRKVWWPVVGFEETIFKESMNPEWESCHSFPGFCDKNIISLVKKKLEQEKVFVYWMSLNSHEPYDSNDVIHYREDICVGWSGGDDRDARCNYQNLHRQFFDGLSDLADSPEMNGVEVVVVGDHPPLFRTDESRKQFEVDRVPVLHFFIRH